MSVLKTIAWVGGLAGAGLLLREGFLALARRRSYAAMYAEAEKRAIESGKMLLVVGNPVTGISMMLGPAYGCGDICIDEAGCPTCQTHLAGPIADLLARFGPDSAVIFVANVVERAPDAPALLHQLARVAGSDLFIAHLEPSSLAAWASQRRVYVAPAGPGTQQQVIYRPNPWSIEAPSEMHVVALAAGYRAPPGGHVGTFIDTTGEPER
jgi:hypothetical protein